MKSKENTMIQSKSKVFVYNGKPYLRVTPVKRLFNSTMVHEVVTRGDFFAVELITSTLTILPQGADSGEQNDPKMLQGNLLAQSV